MDQDFKNVQNNNQLMEDHEKSYDLKIQQLEKLNELEYEDSEEYCTDSSIESCDGKHLKTSNKT